jgi:hypothetical protein
VDDVKEGDTVVLPDTQLKQFATHTHEKDTVKHTSFFARVGSNHGDVSDEQAQRAGYSRAEKVCHSSRLGFLGYILRNEGHSVFLWRSRLFCRLRPSRCCRLSAKHSSGPENRVCR